MLARIKVTGALLLIGSCLIIPALAFLQQQGSLAESMPEGKGGEMVRTVCVACHTLDTVVTRSKSQQSWRATVNDMMGRGAPLSSSEADTIIDYLGEHYGVDSSPASVSSDPPGKDVVTAKCFQCHGDAYYKHVRMSQREWEGVMYRMVGRGALWTEEEINQMAQYFGQVYGPDAP